MAYSINPTHKPPNISHISWNSRQNIPSHLSLSPSNPPSRSSPRHPKTMPLKTLRASNAPILDKAAVHGAPALYRTPAPEFTVIGHRGSGMNTASTSLIKENSILSFNEAGRFPIQYIEFDVQVTSDGRPVIFHDTFILARDGQSVSERRVTDLSLPQLLSLHAAGPLLRRAHDGQIVEWAVEKDDALCTLEEAFVNVSPHLGFNVELKFDDCAAYTDDELARSLLVVVRCVLRHSGDRPVMFSTFQPDAARLVRGMQGVHPVFFLTDGGTEVYGDARRNSLEEAVRLCRECGLQGIVSEVRAVLREPSVIAEAKEAGLGVLTYGELNNVGEVVCLQQLMGVDGVIVDRLREITEAVGDFLGRGEADCDGEGGGKLTTPPWFSRNEIGFLLRLVPELIKK